MLAKNEESAIYIIHIFEFLRSKTDQFHKIKNKEN